MLVFATSASVITNWFVVYETLYNKTYILFIFIAYKKTIKYTHYSLTRNKVTKQHVTIHSILWCTSLLALFYLFSLRYRIKRELYPSTITISKAAHKTHCKCFQSKQQYQFLELPWMYVIKPNHAYWLPTLVFIGWRDSGTVESPPRPTTNLIAFSFEFNQILLIQSCLR